MQLDVRRRRRSYQVCTRYAFRCCLLFVAAGIASRGACHTPTKKRTAMKCTSSCLSLLSPGALIQQYTGMWMVAIKRSWRVHAAIYRYADGSYQAKPP